MDVDILLDPSYHYCRSHSSFHPRLRLRRRLHPPILKMITVSAYHLIIIYSIILSNLQYCNAFLQGISTSVKTTSSSVRVTNSFPSRFAQHKNASTGNCASTDMSTLAQRREYRNKSFMTSSRSNSSSELDAASISESNEVIAAVSSMELGDPVDLKYTEYYDGVENDGSMDHDHDPVILLHGAYISYLHDVLTDMELEYTQWKHLCALFYCNISCCYIHYFQKCLTFLYHFNTCKMPIKDYLAKNVILHHWPHPYQHNWRKNVKFMH